ncbi:glyoxalase_gp060 [Bacillus phage vB_BceM_WH1]|nr:glyoxalase_gp060 [Bacillus phage vB_BceM_WH1]
MFKSLECVSVPVTDLEKAFDFYVSMGLEESWRIEREGGAVLVGLKFPNKKSSELVLNYKGAVPEMEVEIAVGSVHHTVKKLKKNPDVKIIVEPFETESGNVAVFEAPDGNVYVIVD